MGPSHPIRHRFGILLVCLVALFLARDPWYQFPRTRLSQVVQTPSQSYEHRAIAPAQKFDFGYRSASAEDHDLQPFFSYLESSNLKCCDEDSSASPTDKTKPRELNSTLNPNAFPQAEQFVRTGAGDSAIGKPEESSQLGDTYAGFIGAGPRGVWPGTLPSCSNGLQNCQTEAQTPDPGLKIPEPGSLILMLGGLSAIFLLRLAKH
jgi:hypothetical protein